MRQFLVALVLFCCGSSWAADQSAPKDDGWRSLPLIEDGKVSDQWAFVGYGGFKVTDSAIETVPDARGLGLLVFKPEKFGNCRIKVVYRSHGARSNAGVYVRIDDGILKAPQPAPARRDAEGKLTDKGTDAMVKASEQEQGPWYAVHHGFEVQICDAADSFHRTGAVYSLAEAKPAPAAAEGAWKTMIITLDGEVIDVSIDGKPVSHFDGDLAAARERKIWHEPKREPRRPVRGYIGLQTHDPGDIVDFKEIAVAPLKTGNN